MKRRGVTDYTSNNRVAALIAMNFIAGGLCGANVVHAHWWLALPSLLLIVVAVFVIAGEPGPNDP